MTSTLDIHNLIPYQDLGSDSLSVSPFDEGHTDPFDYSSNSSTSSFEQLDHSLAFIKETRKPAYKPRKIAIIGVGYVGLHLVQEFGLIHDVTGFDISPKRLVEVRGALKGLKNVKITCQPEYLAGQDFYLISVPTLLKGTDIDSSYLQNAISLVGEYTEPGSTIVIESSVAVGMTRKLLEPLMRSKNLMGGMSPEVSYLSHPNSLSYIDIS